MSDLNADPQPSHSSDCPLRPGKPMLDRIAARASEIGGGLTVRRALPNPRRRMVGAWCFFDHAGPVEHGIGRGLKVGPHPHIGLQTFTWMIEGTLMHSDSLGYRQFIRPGQVNLMTAGRGIAHAEETPVGETGRAHAAQLWIALPDSERRREPAFEHYPELPVVESGGFKVTVLAGSALGKTAPARVFTPLVGLDLSAKTSAETKLSLEPHFEHAAMVLAGRATVEGEALEPGTLLYLGAGRDSVRVACSESARLLLIGGEPFKEEVLLWWNFVARTPEEIQQATDDWNTGRHFGEVEGVALKRLAAPDIRGLHLKAARKSV